MLLAEGVKCAPTAVDSFHQHSVLLVKRKGIVFISQVVLKVLD